MPGIWETHMTFSQRSRTLFKTLAVMLALALPTALAISSADARVGGGMSSGSRGSRTYLGPAVDHDRAGLDLAVQPHLYPAGCRHEFGCRRTRAWRPVRPRRRLHGRPCGRLPRRRPARHAVRGGLFGGLGGLSSIIGLIIQIALVVLVVRLAMSWWQRRHSQQAAYANADAGSGQGPQPNYRSGLGGGSVGGGLAVVSAASASARQQRAARDQAGRL